MKFSDELLAKCPQPLASVEEIKTYFPGANEERCTLFTDLNGKSYIAERIFSHFGRNFELVYWRYTDASGQVSVKDFSWMRASGGPVIIFPVTANGEVLFSHEFRNGINGCVVEVPGGNPKTGEALRDTVDRELSQETGYKAGRIIELPRLIFDPASCHCKGHGVLALGCHKVGEPQFGASEIIEPHRLPVKEFYDLFWQESGEVDCKTSTLAFQAMPHLKKIGLL